MPQTDAGMRIAAKAAADLNEFQERLQHRREEAVAQQEEIKRRVAARKTVVAREAARAYLDQQNKPVHADVVLARINKAWAKKDGRRLVKPRSPAERDLGRFKICNADGGVVDRFHSLVILRALAVEAGALQQGEIIVD